MIYAKNIKIFKAIHDKHWSINSASGSRQRRLLLEKFTSEIKETLPQKQRPINEKFIKKQTQQDRTPILSGNPK